jgi:DNA-binding FadR family transcriptional regulator
MDMADGNLEAHGLSGLEIHRAIAESSGNSLLRSVTGIVELTLALALNSLSNTDSTSYRSASLAAHDALLHAIETGSKEDAQRALNIILDLDEAQASKLVL